MNPASLFSFSETFDFRCPVVRAFRYADLPKSQHDKIDGLSVSSYHMIAPTSAVIERQVLAFVIIKPPKSVEPFIAAGGFLYSFTRGEGTLYKSLRGPSTK
jgi:hypothetical protein